jgi:hypothetical protein
MSTALPDAEQFPAGRTAANIILASSLVQNQDLEQLYLVVPKLRSGRK